jgi:hypothetical protein
VTADPPADDVASKSPVEDKIQLDTTQVTAHPLADDAAAKSPVEDKIQLDTTQVTADPLAEDAAEAAAKLGDKNDTIDGAGNVDITAEMSVDKNLTVDSVDGAGGNNIVDNQYGSSDSSSFTTTTSSEPKTGSNQKPSTI